MDATTCDVAGDLRTLGMACTKMGSPFYGSLFEHAANAYERCRSIRALLDRHAHRARLGLLFAGAAHYRALSGEAPRLAAHFPSTGGDGDAAAAWEAIEADVLAHEGGYDDSFHLTVQTNEVARAFPLVGAMLAVHAVTGLSLRIFEIGSSAGFLLNLDRYRYSGAGWTWGDESSELELHLPQATRPEFFEGALPIVERRGCDLHPLDVRNPADANRLLSFIWPDQRERFDRVGQAIAVARHFSPAVDRANGVEWVARNALPRAGTCTVVFHSVILEHLTAADSVALQRAIAGLGRSASAQSPFAHVRMESPTLGTGYETRVTLWPGERETLVARSDGHAQRLQWMTQAA
ncbi:MAG TPA: DUF2332 domain-containing protein [Candidatus Baltobacteraceae bacterium]|jgi:hypothetical protein|nr:DUF2332 domain-containing protein [Candidatus Baltobacteraceae bacterium]